VDRQLLIHPNFGSSVDTGNRHGDTPTQTNQRSAWAAPGFAGCGIDVLQAGQYVQSTDSPTFPQLPIVQAVTAAVEQSRSMGRSPALRAFRQWVRQHLQKFASD
jgi:DNA-binding transcriptional LysR family regulator